MLTLVLIYCALHLKACIKSCLATEQYLECGCAEVQFQSPNMPGCNELNSTEGK